MEGTCGIPCSVGPQCSDPFNPQSDDYALAMFQYANVALTAGRNIKTMQILEDLRRNRSYYSEAIQDKVDFQLVHVYNQLGETDFVLKLGEEIRKRLEGREIRDSSDAYDLVSFFKNMADVYLEKKEYDRANGLYEKIIELMEKYKNNQKNFP